MCDNFQCKYCYLELTDSGSTALYCSQHGIFIEHQCSACFFSSCRSCRNCSGSCSDSALDYFKEVLKNGSKLQNSSI